MRVLRSIALGLTALSSLALAQEGNSVPKEKYSYQASSAVAQIRIAWFDRAALRATLHVYVKLSSIVFTRIGIPYSVRVYGRC